MQWAYESHRRAPGSAEAQSFFPEGMSRRDRLTWRPHQQVQARLSTAAGGLWLPSAEARKMSASFRTVAGVIPEVLAGLLPFGRLSEDEAVWIGIVNRLG